MKPSKVVSLVILSVCLAFGVSVANAQPNATADEKSQLIINRAIEALGGASYLNVKTVIGKGFYTTIRDGEAQLPTRFLDTIVYPDRERTEFISLGIKSIQTNSSDR